MPGTNAKHAYDEIAVDYQESKQLSFREHVEAFTLFKLLGDLGGKRVLDLACGDGHYTRLIKQAGADDVLGIDISHEMIALALEAEVGQPLGCRYVRADAAKLDFHADFDLVHAAYLFNYARDEEELRRFCRVAFDALKPGARVVGFNDNPHTDPNQAPSFAPYGFEKRCSAPRREGDPIIYAIHRPDGTSFEITNYYWSPDTYARAFEAAGFADFAWEGPFLGPGQRDNPFWGDFMRHAPLIGFGARRPL
jgi:SAM-dependent methyltransferase